MGKVRRVRQKFHRPAAAAAAAAGCRDDDVPPALVPVAAPAPSPGDSPFSGVPIPPEALHQQLPDFDTRSVRSTRSLKGLPPMKKTEKRKIRRMVLMQKMDLMMESLKSAKAARDRKRTPVVGDMRPLTEALPDLVILEKHAAAKRAAEKQRRQPSQKRKGMPKKKVRQREFMEDIARFQQVLQHPIYQEDPEGIVSEHVQQWVLKSAEEGMDDS